MKAELLQTAIALATGPRTRRTLLAAGAAALAGAAVMTLVGCGANPRVNPSFPLGVTEARHDLRRMRLDRVPLQRPLVVLAGYNDLFGAVHGTSDLIRRLTTTPELVIDINFVECLNFERARKRVIDRVNAAFPTSDPERTVEVDVIGVSMGGLVARFAALPGPTDEHATPHRLHIRTLYTISTPHCGARLSGLHIADHRVRCMVPECEFLRGLDEGRTPDDYPIVPYVRLGDWVVGEASAAPNGTAPWWISPQVFEFSHLQSQFDIRILADILRRLRGEPSWTTEPAAPLP